MILLYLLIGVRVLDANQKYEERRELIEIYNSLSAPLKKQLLTLARVIDTTREITLNERKKYGKKNNPSKDG
jgi:hypothetical protein